MLRGYHPLREIYRWERVILGLLVSFSGLVALGEGVAHSDLASQGHLAFMLVIPLALLLAWFLLLFPGKRRLAKLFRLQKAALNGQGGSLLLAPSDSAPVEVTLPFGAPTCTSRSNWRMLRFSLLFPVGAVLVLQLPFLLPDPYVIPPEVWIGIVPLLAIFYILPIHLVMTITADFYLLPALEVDDHGLLACCGADRVHIAWQQIRSFALVEYKRFGSGGIWTNRAAVQIYAICDGENTIAWYVDPRGKMRQPSSLSLDEYASLLGRQLPALVRLKTGLPLLDLCEPRQTKATSFAPPR